MRTARMITLAAGAIALALLLPAKPADAMTLPAPSGLATAAQGTNAVEQVRTVCRRYWNGYRWRSRCWWVGPGRYYGPGPYYYGPRRYYGPGYRYRHWRRW